MAKPESSVQIIEKLQSNANLLMSKISKKMYEEHKLSSADSFQQLELELQQTAKELADVVAGIKLQEHLDKEETKNEQKELIKSQPSKIKNMGLRPVSLHMLGGTVVTVLTAYYHRKATLKKHKGKKGFYPGLLLLGVANRYSPGLESLIGLLATASSSFSEATLLIKATLNFKIDVKKVSATVKFFGKKARAAVELDKFVFPDNFSGRTVAASADGGRIRIRTNKRGKKTNKRRTRFHTDWREPKLIIIYIIGPGGEKQRTSLPLMDASLRGPDATFELLIFYLKKLKVDASDLLVFLSDGAKWIWERAKSLASKIGIKSERCMFALDYYHAVEHLSDLASAKKWDKRKKNKWVKMQKKRLLNGNLEKFMDEIESVCKGSKNDKVKRERQYFQNHKPHMRYAELKLQGLPIGSGAVESGIRRVVNLRLKGPGIFWHQDSADAMLILRSYYKAGRWETLTNAVFSSVSTVI